MPQPESMGMGGMGEMPTGAGMAGGSETPGSVTF
jgi:hypothetical protein